MEAQNAIDSLVATFYGVFDNRAGRVPSAESFEALFATSASIVTHGGGEPRVATPADFVEPRVALLTGGELEDFREWETESHTEINGTLAVRRSRYAKQGWRRGTSYAGAGTKYFQFANTSSGWRITSLSWIDDAGG